MHHETKRCLMLISGAYHSVGGIAAVNRLTIRALAAGAYAIDVLSLLEADPTVDPAYLTPDMQITSRVFAGSKLQFTRAAWSAILRRPYEFVLVDHINLASILAPFARLGRCRYVVWLYGVEVLPPRPDFEGRLGLRHAWKPLAISDYTREKVVARYPELAIDTVDLALDPVRHADALPIEPVTPPEPSIEIESICGSRQALLGQVILHVGRMATNEQYKGQDVLLQAFPVVLRSFSDAQLVLVGHGDDWPRLLALARSLPASAQSRVFMPGQVDDALLDRLYRRCYVFAMPSRGEGFGLVYLEAMSRAKPCLGARADATPYVVRDRWTGLLVDDPTSPAEVGDTIIWLLAHPDDARQMGLAGYELVRTRYLFSQFSQRFWQALQVE